MVGVRLGNTAELWRDPELGVSFDPDPDPEEDSPVDAQALRSAKLISAAMIAKVLDAPCTKCARAEQDGTPRKGCRVLGCDRWSTRRARRWMRRSQCSQHPGAPACPARTGGGCSCTVGFRLAAGGAWCTTLARLRDKFPDLLDLVLVAQADED
jgi:hypothetical protein